MKYVMLALGACGIANGLSKKSSQVKYINTDKHILRFAKNNRTAARKAFCLIVICVSCSSSF